MAPIYKGLAENYKDKVNFGEINCQSNQELCSEQGAKGVPYFKMFYKGKSGKDIIGETTKDSLTSLVQDYIT
jgi:thiol-disulfide isomerase/thioredoxin